MSYIVPIGPYHPALEEPIHAKLYTEGEVIRDADVFVGYNHRGIEKLATERNAIQTLVLVERVCGICSHSHAFTYAMCVESINGIEVPKRGQYIRVITAELERLHSHFLWLGIACHIIGHDSMFMHIWDERELVMDLLEKMTGNRVNYAMVTIGGARRDISAELYASQEALAAGSGERAEEYAEKALQKWLGAEQYTHIFVRHSEIDATADAFYDLMQSLSGGEYDGIEQAYSKLLYHLSSIATMEQISLGSIM